MCRICFKSGLGGVCSDPLSRVVLMPRGTFAACFTVLLSLHLTHNNTQNKMSRCRPTPAALPHISMATSAMDPNHGAVDPYESNAGAGWPCSLSPRLVPLVGPTNEDASKIKEGGGSSALGGRRWVLRHNNQPIVGGSDRRDDGEYVWPG